MDSLTNSFYPLSNASREDLAGITLTLWGWAPNLDWIRGDTCKHTDGCTCLSAQRLEPFFDFYRNTTSCYLPDIIGHSYPALRSHKDLRDIIALLRENPDTQRNQLTSEYFASRKSPRGQMPPPTDQDRAFNLAVRVLMMVHSAAYCQSDGLLEAGMEPLTWHGDKSLAEFFRIVFPKRDHPNLDPYSTAARSTKGILASITAKRLQKVAKLQIIATDDLSNHLFLDETSGTLAIFHYTGVLKESLAMPCSGDGSGAYESQRGAANIRTCIPPQLALETLCTIKEVLFPVDQTSQTLLRSLVSNNAFDPDILRIFNHAPYLPETEEVVHYQYWGSRLVDLHDEVENPTPRGYFERWLERKSGARPGLAGNNGSILSRILDRTGIVTWATKRQTLGEDHGRKGRLRGLEILLRHKEDLLSSERLVQDGSALFSRNQQNLSPGDGTESFGFRLSDGALTVCTMPEERNKHD